MSEDWHVYCATCGVSHDFDDANHENGLMLTLIGLAEPIAALADLVLYNSGVSISTPWGDVKPRWFADHSGHLLVARSEYGNIVTPGGLCGARAPVEVPRGRAILCSLQGGHDGEHRGEMGDVSCVWDGNGFEARRHA